MKRNVRLNKGLKFSYTVDSPEVRHLTDVDPKMKELIGRIGAIDVELCEDFFPFLVHIIVEQLVSVAAANTIYGRLEDACGGAVSAKALMETGKGKLRACGLSETKADAILAVSQMEIDWKLKVEDLDHMADADVVDLLTAVKGIGPWTAKMVLMFALGREDFLPTEDAAFRRAFRDLYGSDEKELIEKTAEKWQPYRSVAVRYLYRSLDEETPDAGAK